MVDTLGEDLKYSQMAHLTSISSPQNVAKVLDMLWEIRIHPVLNSHYCFKGIRRE